MSSQISQISAQVFRAGTYPSWKEGCNPIPKQAVSTMYESQGQIWQVPITENGAVQDYIETYEDASLISGAVLTVRLKHVFNGDVLYILGTEQDWLDRVNQCCGDTPTMPEITISQANLEDEACSETVISESSPVYPRFGSVGTITAGTKITVSGSANGVAFSPADSAGFDTYEDAISWINSNWSAYGVAAPILDTLSNVVGISFKAVDKKGSFSVDYKKRLYCMTLQTGDEFNEVVNNGVTYALGKTIVVVSAAQVASEISDYFGDATVNSFNGGSDLRVQYNGIGVPNAISMDGAVVRSFTSGTCQITPDAPTSGVVDNTANTFDWTNTPGYTTLAQYEQTLDSGATWTDLTAKPIAGLTGTRAIGSVGVRVKAANGNNPSAGLFNASAFS